MIRPDLWVRSKEKIISLIFKFLPPPQPPSLPPNGSKSSVFGFLKFRLKAHLSVIWVFLPSFSPTQTRDGCRTWGHTILTFAYFYFCFPPTPPSDHHLARKTTNAYKSLHFKNLILNFTQFDLERFFRWSHKPEKGKHFDWNETTKRISPKSERFPPRVAGNQHGQFRSSSVTTRSREISSLKQLKTTPKYLRENCSVRQSVARGQHSTSSEVGKEWRRWKGFLGVLLMWKLSPNSADAHKCRSNSAIKWQTCTRSNFSEFYLFNGDSTPWTCGVVPASSHMYSNGGNICGLVVGLPGVVVLCEVVVSLSVSENLVFMRRRVIISRLFFICGILLKVVVWEVWLERNDYLAEESMTFHKSRIIRRCNIAERCEKAVK